MKINTKYFGEMEVIEDEIIEFKSGLLGFMDSKKFVIINMPDNPHFKFLQDINNTYVSFVIINPWDFFSDYDVDLADAELEKININQSNCDKISVYVVVTMGKTLKESSANLIAPVVINNTEQLGKQLIVDNSNYTTKHPLISELVGD
jgi:flagellar assembly factor FliW